MNDTVVPDPNAIADAMLKRIGELLRDRDVANAGKPATTSPFRLASYFANEAPDGSKPQYAQVAEECRHFPDVFPLYFAPSSPIDPKAPPRLTPERISELWDGMPGGGSRFGMEWGYMQFAQAVEAEVRATLLAEAVLVADIPNIAADIGLHKHACAPLQCTEGISVTTSWFQAGSLLYRLTDDVRPQNCDEINVTMASGSRDKEARAERASELLLLLTRANT